MPIQVLWCWVKAKRWSRWVRLNKIFPVLEDKWSSSRSVEQFHSTPGLSSCWGSAAWCFSAESSWAREPGVVVFGGIWWYSWPTRVGSSPSCSHFGQNTLGKKLHVRPSTDHSSASCRSTFWQGSISCWNIGESPVFRAEQPLASQVVLLLWMLCFILFSILAVMEVDSAWWIHSCTYSRWSTPLWSQQST